MAPSTSAALEALLDHERALVKSGRMAELAGLEARKYALTQAISQSSVSAQDLARIQEKLRRNAVLLQAAGAGLKSAQRRLSALRRAAGPISSYGAEGQRQEIGSAPPSLTKKA